MNPFLDTQGHVLPQVKEQEGYLIWRSDIVSSEVKALQSRHATWTEKWKKNPTVCPKCDKLWIFHMIVPCGFYPDIDVHEPEPVKEPQVSKDYGSFRCLHCHRRGEKQSPSQKYHKKCYATIRNKRKRNARGLV